MPMKSFRKIVPPISKAKIESVIEVLANEATRLEELKHQTRAAYKCDGKSDAEIDSLLPPYPAGSMGL